MSEDLKPCPFCGGKDVELDSPYQENWTVECIDCWATGSMTKEFDKGASAIKAWNARAKPTFTKEDVDKALLAISEVHRGSKKEGELIVKTILNAVGRVE